MQYLVICDTRYLTIYTTTSTVRVVGVVSSCCSPRGLCALRRYLRSDLSVCCAQASSYTSMHRFSALLLYDTCMLCSSMCSLCACIIMCGMCSMRLAVSPADNTYCGTWFVYICFFYAIISNTTMFMSCRQVSPWGTAAPRSKTVRWIE